MTRGRRGRNVRTSAPREGTFIVASILWLVGFADVILNLFHLPNELGIWALVVAGLLLILGSLVEGL